MVRKIWIASLLVALTGAGFSLNYLAMASTPVQEKAKDRTLTVTEQGKSPRKCKVLRSWNTPDGNKAFQVEALDNGEYLTIVTQKESSSTKIYHWQNHKTPPKNCPFPPEQLPNPTRIVEAAPAIKKSNDLPMQKAVNTSKSPLPTGFPTLKTPEPKASQPTEFVTIPAPGADKVVDSAGKKSPLSSVLTAKTKEAPKTVASTQNKPAVETKPSSLPNRSPDKVIVIKEEKTLVKTEVGQEKVIAVTPIANKKPTMEKVPEALASVTTPAKKTPEPTKIQVVAPTPKTTVTKLPDNSKTTKTPDLAKEKPATPKPLEKTIVENPKPQDWRKSWGKMDEVASKPTFKPSADVELPHADTSKPDPLKTPDQFHPTLEEKVARRAEKVLGKDNGKKELEKITSPAKTTAQLAEEQPPRTVAPLKKPTSPNEKVVIIKEESTTKARKIANSTPKTPGLDIFDKTIGRLIGLRENAPRPLTGFGKFNLGTRSVADSGYDTEFAIPFGQMGRPPVPMAFMPPPAPPMNVPQAPQIYPDAPATTLIARAPTQGMANAFTDVPNQRPIPADMESTEQMQNAFQQPYNPEQQMQAAQAHANAMAMAYQAQRMSQPYAYMQAQAPTHHAMIVEQLVVLKTSLHPSQREFAAEQLGQISLRGNSEVIQTLFHGVKNDPAPTVRAACIRSLTRMKIHTIETMDLFRGMKTDQDPRVRLEADKALIQQTSAFR